jgi:hypothetical protein
MILNSILNGFPLKLNGFPFELSAAIFSALINGQSVEIQQFRCHSKPQSIENQRKYRSDGMGKLLVCENIE